MKRLTQKTNKWILSGLLLSALGSQYYYSVSSNNINIAQFPISNEQLIRLPAAASPAAPAVKADTQKAELAKKAARLNEVNSRLKEIEQTLIIPNLPANAIADLNKEKQKLLAEKKRLSSEIKKAKDKAPAKTSKRASSDLRAVDGGADDVEDDEEAPKSGAKPAAAPAPAVVAPAVAPSADPNMTNIDQTYSLSCTTCENSKPMNLNAKDYQLVLDFLNKKNTEKKPLGDTRKTDDAPEGETPSERRERLATAKAEKLKEELEARNEEFLEKAQEIALDCNEDLECKVDRFKTLMEKFSGSKKVNSSKVILAYNKIISKDLITGLASDFNGESKLVDGVLKKSESKLAIRLLMDNLPSEYSSLKIHVLEGVKALQTAQSQEVTKVLKLADTIAKTNPEQSSILRRQGVSAIENFKNEATSIQNNMLIGINSSQDRSTLEYIKSQYIPDVSSLLNQMLGITTAPTTANQPTVTPTPNSPPPGTTIPGTSQPGTGNRGGRGNGTTGNGQTNGSTTGGTNSVLIGSPTTILLNGRSGVNYRN